MHLTIHTFYVHSFLIHAVDEYRSSLMVTHSLKIDDNMREWRVEAANPPSPSDPNEDF